MPAPCTLTGVDEPERVSGEFVSQAYFDLLGVRPALGRTFRPEEDQVPQRDAVVILSDGLWKRRFGGDPAVAGRTVQLDGRGYTIHRRHAGLVSRRQRPGRVLDAVHDDRHRRGFRRARHPRLPRARPPASPASRMAQAQAELDGISQRLEAAYPAHQRRPRRGSRPLDRELLRRSATAADGAALRRRLRAADRLHQRRQPACWRAPKRGSARSPCASRWAPAAPACCCNSSPKAACWPASARPPVWCWRTGASRR